MSFLSVIKKIFGFGSSSNKLQPGDRLLRCEDCKKEFVFDAGEQKFFRSKGFTDPKRCPECRKNIKVKIRKNKRPFSQSNRNNRGNRHSRYKRHSNSRVNSPYVDEY